MIHAFWSHDYVSGVEALTNSLSVSVAENKQFLAMVTQRARIEHDTAANLAQLSQEPVMHAVPTQPGTFVSKSSTLQSALGVFTTETINQAVSHTRIASDLESRVKIPLQKWCNMYARRVDQCVAKLNTLVAGYNRLLQAVNKQRVTYYENCQRFEDSTSGGSPRDPFIKTIRLIRDKWNITNDPEGNSPSTIKEFTVAGLKYSRSELVELMRLLLEDVTLIEYKVPLLGSYENVTTGSMLATAARKHLQNDSFAYAEKFGQSLVDLGYIKPVGQISNRFQSLHTSYYQWQDAAFDLADESSDESDTMSNTGSDIEPDGLDIIPTPRKSSTASSRTSLRGSRAASVDTNGEGIVNASDPSEEYYLQAVLELDKYRCDMEQEMMEIYQFLDRLERDRESAIKHGMHDYIQVAFRVEEQQQMKSRLQAAQHQVNPSKDLRELISKNKTGPFVPTVTVFRGYFDGKVVQTFGVDLAQSKFFVDIVLDWLRKRPREETSQILLWTEIEPISEIYKLRSQINTGKPFSADSLFRFFPLSVVVSTFRQYLLELPESLVPFIVYERFKQLYSDKKPTPTDIATVLVQIPHVNRSVLQALIAYLRDIFVESQYNELAESLSLPLARPRAPSAVTMDDEHPKLLIHDLLTDEAEIYKELSQKENELKFAKGQQRPQISRTMYPESPTPAAPPSSTRVESNSGMRPLSLNLHSNKSALLMHSTPGRNDGAGVDSPSPKTNNIPRGLGISPILPISVKSDADLSSSTRSPSSPLSSSPASPTPQARLMGNISSSDLRLPRVRAQANKDDAA